MAEKITKKELQEQKENLKSEIERLQKIIDAASETTFEIITEDLKRQMIENVQKEMWAGVKSNIREVDSVKGTQEFIEKQSTLLAKKKEELAEVEENINNFQGTIFDKGENKK